MQLIESGIILLLTAVIVLFGCKICKSKKFNEDYLSLENTLPLRGVMAIFIVFHHLSGYAGSGTLISIFNHIGYLIVAVFFFLSGYGLYYGFTHKKNYMKGFLIKRLPSVIIPFWIANIIYMIGLNLSGIKVSVTDLLKSAIGIDLIVGGGWYICMLVVMYLVFYISFVFKNGKARLIVFAVLFLAVQFGFMFLNLDEEWTRSLIAFPLGIVWCKYKDGVDKLIHKHWIISFISSGFLLAITLGVKLVGEHFNNPVLKFIGNASGCVMICLFIFVCLNKITLNNAILRFVGKISIDIYLYQFLVMRILNKLFELNKFDLALYTLATFIGTIIISFIINYIEKYIIKGLAKLTKQ